MRTLNHSACRPALRVSACRLRADPDRDVRSDNGNDNGNSAGHICIDAARDRAGGNCYPRHPRLGRPASDGGPQRSVCLYRQFLGVSAPTFPELATVQISDYTIRYAENTLYFDFTVTASGLDTRRPGTIGPEVDWDFGVMLRFLEDDPTVTDEDFPCEDCRGLIGDFVMFEHRWNFPDYGTWGTREPENFIVWHYSDGLEMTLADYAATAERCSASPQTESGARALLISTKTVWRW